MKKLIIMILLSLSFVSTAFANSREHHLLVITSDATTDVLDLSLRVDTHDRATRFILTNRKDRNFRQEFNINQISRGLVLMESDGHNVVTLRSADFSADKGGFVLIDYLNSGLTKSRRNAELELEHNSRKWVLLNSGKEINQMHLRANRFFGQVVGINSITTR